MEFSSLPNTAKNQKLVAMLFKTVLNNALQPTYVILTLLNNIVLHQQPLPMAISEIAKEGKGPGTTGWLLTPRIAVLNDVHC